MTHELEDCYQTDPPSKCSWSCAEAETLCHIQCYFHFRKLAVSLRVEYIIWSSNSISRYLSKENGKICSYMKSCVFMTVKMWKKIKMSITWKIDLKKMWPIHINGLLSNNRKTVATNNIIQHGWASKHAKWKKPNPNATYCTISFISNVQKKTNLKR